VKITDLHRRIVRGGEARATALLTSKLDELHRVCFSVSCHLKALNCRQLAHALVEHETLDSDEVKKVIRGEPIRNITDVLDEELSNIPASAGAPGL
jgi:ATP-dependent metalloprotease